MPKMAFHPYRSPTQVPIGTPRISAAKYEDMIELIAHPRFEYGKKSKDEIIKGVSRGIFVTGFIGGNSNGTTGDFSFGISGMFIENGELVKPVYEMNISGNMKDLWNQLVEIGNDPDVYSSWRTPTLHFNKVQFSGI